MKKLIGSLVLLVGLSFNVNAGPTATGLSVQPWALPVAVMVAASQVEYKACNDLPYVKVKAENGNYFFDSSQCDTKK